MVEFNNKQGATPLFSADVLMDELKTNKHLVGKFNTQMHCFISLKC
tara:strand:- start:569 stop:706 length:138 start_codon:yes stop_codon:yes gene_type:complete